MPGLRDDERVHYELFFLGPGCGKLASLYAKASFALLGVSAAATVTTLVTGVLALNAKSAFESECLPTRSYCSDPTTGGADYDRMRNMAWVSTLSLGVAVTAFVVGLVWPKQIVTAKATALAIQF